MINIKVYSFNETAESFRRLKANFPRITINPSGGVGYRAPTLEQGDQFLRAANRLKKLTQISIRPPNRKRGKLFRPDRGETIEDARKYLFKLKSDSQVKIKSSKVSKNGKKTGNDYEDKIEAIIKMGIPIRRKNNIRIEKRKKFNSLGQEWEVDLALVDGSIYKAIIECKYIGANEVSGTYDTQMCRAFTHLSVLMSNPQFKRAKFFVIVNKSSKKTKKDWFSVFKWIGVTMIIINNSKEKKRFIEEIKKTINS